VRGQWFDKPVLSSAEGLTTNGIVNADYRKEPLVSREWLETRSVIPAKAGIQLTLLWIPAFAGKTIAGRECRTILPT
jgi:hypothetical protein